MGLFNRILLFIGSLALSSLWWAAKHPIVTARIIIVAAALLGMRVAYKLVRRLIA